jgi:hypothetical protein
MSNEPTIIEMNRAICEFEGWEFKEVEPDWFEAFHDGQLQWADSQSFIDRIMLKGFNFHEDWNRLMPVVEKIHDLCISGDAINGIVENNIFNFSIFAPLPDVFNAVYQFIQWYNKQKEANNEPSN